MVSIKVLLAAASVMLGSASGSFAEQVEPIDQAQQPQHNSRSRMEMGLPVPGMANDHETTKKKRNPTRDHGPQANAQVTLGGAQYFVYGGVLKVEGDQLLVKESESGNTLSLIVDKDTNLDCGERPNAGGSMASDRAADKHGTGPGRLSDQGQRIDETAIGSGFQVGDCSFKTGDRVKAE